MRLLSAPVMLLILAAFWMGPANLITSGCGGENPPVQFSAPRNLAVELGLQGTIVDSLGLAHSEYSSGGGGAFVVLVHSGLIGPQLLSGSGTGPSHKAGIMESGSQLVFIVLDETGNVTGMLLLDEVGGETNRHPAIGVGGEGAIFVAWQDNSTGPDDWNLWVRRSTDGGASFEPRVQVNDVATNAPDQPIDLVYAEPGYIHVAWTAKVEGQWAPHFDKAKWDDLVFGVDVQLEDNPTQHGQGSSPHLAQDDAGNIFATWHTGVEGFRVGVQAAMSGDQGDSFGPATAVNPEPGTAFNHGEFESDSLVEDGVHFVLWNQGAPETCENCSHLLFSSSADGGGFSEPTQISNGPGIIFNRQVEYIAGGLFLSVWATEDPDGQNPAKWFSTSDDHGATWTGPWLVPGSEDHIHRFAFDVSADTAFLVWPGDVNPDGSSPLYFSAGPFSEDLK